MGDEIPYHEPIWGRNFVGRNAVSWTKSKHFVDETARGRNFVMGNEIPYDEILGTEFFPSQFFGSRRTLVYFTNGFWMKRAFGIGNLVPNHSVGPAIS